MKKRLIIIACVCAIALLATHIVYGLDWRVERVRVIGRSQNIVEDYEDYYLRANTKRIQNWIMGGTNTVTDIYFLPRQRARMTERIREDIINELEILVNDHSNIFYRYEISDDFRQARIYEATSPIDGLKQIGTRNDVSIKIGTLIELYNTIKEGQTARFQDRTVVFVEHSD